MQLESGTVIEASALLFDMDGTLIDSRVVVEKIWKRWCDENGIDWHVVLPRLHGVRMMDSVKMFATPGMDVDAVFERLYREEVEDVDGIVPIPGAHALLAALPPTAWTIVTSADTVLAKARLEIGARLERAWPGLEETRASGYLVGRACAAGRVALPLQDELIFHPCRSGRPLDAHPSPPVRRLSARGAGGARGRTEPRQAPPLIQIDLRQDGALS